MRDFLDFTPLMLCNSVTCAEALIQAGADLRFVNLYGQSVLHGVLMLVNINLEVADWLEAQGLDPDAPDLSGRTPRDLRNEVAEQNRKSGNKPGPGLPK